MHMMNNEPMTVIATLPAYTIGKLLGIEEGNRELQRQVLNPDKSSLPGVRTIARLRELTSLQVRIDTGGTQLCAVRSRHAHEAWQSGADVWFSVDDDNEATTDTLASMLEAVRGEQPRIVVAPYIIRAAPDAPTTVNVDLPRIITTERRLSNGARLRPVTKSGFGLLAMNRGALGAVREQCKHLAYLDTDDVERLALFFHEIKDRRWLHDDFGFFSRVPSYVTVEALLTGVTSHAGEVLNLSELE